MSTPQKAQTRHYGSWPSAITADTVSQQAVVFENVAVDPIHQEVLHSERRPAEGRTVIVKSSGRSDVTKKPFNARTLVNGYGGVPMAVRNGTIIFSNVPDNRLYKITGSDCVPITPDRREWRYADLSFHPITPKFVACVFEDQTDPRPSAVLNSLAVVDINSGDIKIIHKGWDFYASPVFSPNGKKIAFLRWNHPNMPWQSCQLVLCDVVPDEGALCLKHEKVIAGETGNTAAQQPRWVSDNLLLFTYDKLDWTQIWKCTVDSDDKEPVLSEIVEEEFTEPLWRLGEASYAVLGEGRILCKSIKGGFSSLSLIDIKAGTKTPIESPYVSISSVQKVDSESAVFVGSKVDKGGAIVKVTLKKDSKATFVVLVSPSEKDADPGLVPQPDMMEFKDSEGRPLYALYHPPTNPDFVGPPDERPPCVVSVHGGPTSRTEPSFSWNRILYTSRGWAWLDIYYGGSTGYGRQYMARLNGTWGVLDPADCAAAARQAAERGLVDATRIIIRGYSAGGFNVLQSLITFPNFYACGTAFYGISDLKRLHETTHKFQSQYIPGLVGGSPEEVPVVYKDRSPLFNANKIRVPVLLLHGTADLQVPVEQTESIVKIIRQNGGRVELETFEGEGHGFRLIKNIKASLEKELNFYEEILTLKR